VDYFAVAGRGSVAHNAQQLAGHFANLPKDDRPLVVFAYSKGLVDLLEFVVKFPDLARPIAAVVSVAGASNGSPLADRMHAIYRSLGARFRCRAARAAPATRFWTCTPTPASRGGRTTAIQCSCRSSHWSRRRSPTASLQPLARRTTSLQRSIRATMASCCGTTRSARSYLLGYVNADHWSIAVPVLKEAPQASFLFRDTTPRTALVEAAIAVVAGTRAVSMRQGQPQAAGDPGSRQ